MGAFVSQHSSNLAAYRYCAFASTSTYDQVLLFASPHTDFAPDLVSESASADFNPQVVLSGLLATCSNSLPKRYYKS